MSTPLHRDGGLRRRPTSSDPSSLAACGDDSDSGGSGGGGGETKTRGHRGLQAGQPAHQHR